MLRQKKEAASLLMSEDAPLADCLAVSPKASLSSFICLTRTERKRVKSYQSRVACKRCAAFAFGLFMMKGDMKELATPSSFDAVTGAMCFEFAQGFCGKSHVEQQFDLGYVRFICAARFSR